jgi:hypothetical protein
MGHFDDTLHSHRHDPHSDSDFGRILKRGPERDDEEREVNA